MVGLRKIPPRITLILNKRKFTICLYFCSFLVQMFVKTRELFQSKTSYVSNLCQIFHYFIDECIR